MNETSPTKTPTVFQTLGACTLAFALAACSTTPSAPGDDQSGATLSAQGTLTITVPTTTLSGAVWTSATNGNGPVELNRSSGGPNANDGRTLMLNGKKYPRGYGVAAASSMAFAAAGRCATLKASIGLDDEVGTAGSVVFQVYGDGVKLYDSGTMTGASATKAISVDVAGRMEVRLVVTDAGDGTASDHADWIAPQLLGCADTVLAVTSSPAPLPAGTYTAIASEGQAFTLSGTQTVWYGAGNTWLSKSVTTSGTCSNTFFGGDPLPGTTKVCQVAAVPAVTAISVTPTSTSLTAGTTVQANATVTATNGGSTTVTWKTSDASVATVDSAGQVTAVAVGSATVTATATLDPTKSAAVAVTVTAPAPTTAPAPSTVTYAAPLTITTGGTYRGAWESLDPAVAAVTVKTTAPVTIENCFLRGKGKLISVPWVRANLTVRGCHGEGLNPNNPTLVPGRFLHAEGFESVILEHNTIEKTSGIYLNAWAGSSRAQPILIRYNRANNIEGRYSDGNGGWQDGKFYRVQFVQLNSVKNVAGAEIAWNRVDNSAYQSHIEDTINLYASSGTAASPIRVHNNLLNGAFGTPPSGSYSGGGIMMGDGGGQYQEAVNNTVLETSNYGVAVAGGNDMSIKGNLVLGLGKLADGTLLDADTDAGIYIRDYSNDPAHVASSVIAQGNTVGWGSPNATNASARWDYSISATAGVDGGNTRVAAGPIDPALLAQAITDWTIRLSTAGLTVGAR